MIDLFRTSLAAMAVVLLGGCVEVAYKRGADETVLEAARSGCKAQNRQAYAECMDKQGWLVYQPDDSRLNLALVANSDNRSEAPRPAAATLTARHLAAEQEYEIGSWWRFGASDDGLKGDAASCAARLGKQYGLTPRPGGGYRVNGALLMCLQERGWRGLPAG